MGCATKSRSRDHDLSTLQQCVGATRIFVATVCAVLSVAIDCSEASAIEPPPPVAPAESTPRPALDESPPIAEELTPPSPATKAHNDLMVAPAAALSMTYCGCTPQPNRKQKIKQVINNVERCNVTTWQCLNP